MSSPKLICLTPVRNEQWCLKPFLKAASIWADHILIANQHSTDDSAQIAAEFEKVMLIENKDDVYNEASRQSLLIAEARKIPGNKILVALDADEMFSPNFLNTNDWQRILNSAPGEVFGLKWVNIEPNWKQYTSPDFYYPWIFHDDGITEHKNYVRAIHSMRIPYPIEADAHGYNQVNDFKVLHFAHLNPSRQKSKARYYQMTEILQGEFTNPIAAYRTYTPHNNQKMYDFPSTWLEKYKKIGIDLKSEIDIESVSNWFDQMTMEYLNKFGANRFGKIDIWREKWLSNDGRKVYKDPRTLSIKLLHMYLKLTHPFYPARLIRLFDKGIKYCFL